MKNLNLILIIGILFASACSNKNISKTENELTMSQETEEVRDISSIWILESVNGSTIDAENVFLEINMTDLSFNGKSFCNNIFGKMEPEYKSKIKFKNIGMTMMSCNEDLMAMEIEYNGILRRISSYKIKKDLLYLYDYNGKLVLNYRYVDTKKEIEEVGEIGVYNHEKTPLLKLYDIWGLKQMLGQEVEMSKNLILEMNTKEMTFSGFASCNRMFGSLESSAENQLSFTNIGATRKLCSEMSIENEYLENLRKVKSYQLKGLKLFLLDQDENVLLEYIKID